MYMRYTKFTHILDELAKKDKTFCLFYDNSLKTALRQSKNFQAAGKVPSLEYCRPHNPLLHIPLHPGNSNGTVPSGPGCFPPVWNPGLSFRFPH